MALSLADELAAFDNPQAGPSQSLAAEFGLDLEAELGLGPGSGEFGMDGGATLDDELQFGGGFGRPINPLPTGQSAEAQMNTATSSPRGSIGSPSRLHDFDTSLSTPPSPSSPMSSTFEEPTTNPSTLYPLDAASHLQGVSSPLRPPNEVRGKGLRSGNSSRSLRAGKEDDEPLLVLSEVMTTNSKFITGLRQMDEPHPPLPRANASTSSRSSTPQIKAIPKDTVDTLLHRHLVKMQESERARDEQLRELGVISRDMGSVAWGEAGEPSSPRLDLVEEDEEKEDTADLGWVGESMVMQEDAPRLVDDIDRHLEDDGVEEEPFNSTDALLEDPFSTPQLAPSSDPSRTNHPNLPVLASQTLSVISTSTSLSHTLSSLSDSLHTSSSQSTFLSRQIRSLRAAVQGFREREDMEDEAWKGVEHWERSKVEEGLRGGKGVNMEMERVWEEFEELWDGAKADMDRIRNVRVDV
ncbi:hypothetical protein L202_04656 [Cryptococcus amylolentus CBS 6039]|uniref:Uncharacterized protein n=1 Tax=Cryptococcus amylolentus CBS 6039 TaxID=1295533 RepID=A0A1E3HMA4_9TREE|nr:hypothetical protein L202_04656 [Cryptococcus amylolentus CBS 6039]ODN77482.1 hypothetical protein L202_04656 [Cryptococcus amylolentus CBS 6039]